MSTNEKNILSSRERSSRRSFIRGAALAVGAVPALRILGQQDAHAQAPTVAVDEKSPMANALGYVHDYKKADTARFPTAKAAIDNGNICAKCVLMTEKGLKADGQEGNWGRCSLFPTGLVNENGWCMSFAPKPA